MQKDAQRKKIDSINLCLCTVVVLNSLFFFSCVLIQVAKSNTAMNMPEKMQNKKIDFAIFQPVLWLFSCVRSHSQVLKFVELFFFHFTHSFFTNFGYIFWIICCFARTHTHNAIRSRNGLIEFYILYAHENGLIWTRAQVHNDAWNQEYNNEFDPFKSLCRDSYWPTTTHHLTWMHPHMLPNNINFIGHLHSSSNKKWKEKKRKDDRRFVQLLVFLFTRAPCTFIFFFLIWSRSFSNRIWCQV